MGIEIRNLSKEQSLFLIKLYELGMGDACGQGLNGLSNILELDPNRFYELITELSDEGIIVIKDRALYFTDGGLYEFKKHYKLKIKTRCILYKLKAMIIEGISKGIVKGIIAFIALVFTFYSGLYFGSEKITNAGTECTSGENVTKSPKA